MPEISRFLGIIIAMSYNEHAPSHFHVRYDEHEATIRIEDGAVEGILAETGTGSRARMVWCHREELQENWERARTRKPLRKIEPLE